ncbi:hypothetical protein JCM24511_09894 [Saitozyma sp. JCM 24511]|nr:hypothetical protein JCM24511_09894 [Saitozyma sp. JCM 24511]
MTIPNPIHPPHPAAPTQSSQPSSALPARASTLIIGGGPSGLVSLKYAREYGPRWAEGEGPVLVEMEGDVGGTFRWRDYDNAELVSSKQLTCFSDFRYPLESPDHPSLPNFVEYLRSYASAFSLWPHIHLRLKVVSLSKVPPERVVDGYSHHAVLRRVLDDGSLAEGQDDIHLTCQRVVITTGLHVLPNIPVIPGLNDGTETLKSPAWIHSSEYKSRDQLRDKEVLVLGAGETGMDVAYESVLAPARKVWMGVRSGFLSFPKVLNNFRVLGSTFEGALPIDGLITNLFETAYVHPWVSASHLRWFVSDFVIRRVLWVLTGTQAGCNQWAGELPPERQGRAYVFLNKSAKAMQFINRPYASLSPLHRLFAHYQDPPLPEGVDDPTIHVVPFPSRFDHTGKAIFPPPPAHRSKEKAWKETCRPDLVVLCTGYRQEFGWLGEGYPRGPDECNVRGVCSDKDLSVAFIGFLRPGVGAIPPMAEMQIQLFLLLTTQSIPLPNTPENYHLLHAKGSRIQYGVDYSTYQATLARDMGAAPGLMELWWEYGWFVVLIYWLVGPYKSDKAAGIVRTELWDTIRRRGVVGNIFMGVIPMVSAAW